MGPPGQRAVPTASASAGEIMTRIGQAHAPDHVGFSVRPKDIIFIGSFFSLYMGSWGALAGGERLGAVCFPFGAGVPGQTERAIEWNQRDETDGLLRDALLQLYMPSAAVPWVWTPKRLCLSHPVVSGEPGPASRLPKRLIEETYGGHLY